ncbi:response regulator transcription factor [Nitrococcus mobilis]|uniref:DNA-binding response regulator n=1 Tax=Nitrococcus mobilis Nb-231 TaxID=314278 RepID=A4BNI4_9GAMM|nr:response regulator transcription factor [Nitrococcus mobilis]EAR22783.1 DNA-binding response regulator [Nitrococcus mobilis Nb-231]
MLILVVEDDYVLAEGLRRDLKRAGFAVDLTGSAVDAAHLGREALYDLIVLDLGLPDGAGLEMLRGWRAAGNPIPVLILTARDAWYERVDGFKAGADDYLGKPFHTEELLARVGALLRRAHRQQPSGPLQSAGLVLDEEEQKVILPDQQPVRLTATEFRLLRYFMLNPQRLLSKARLTEHVYAEDGDPDSNVLEVYVNRLRRKLGSDYIETRRGQGYRFRDPTAA